VQQDPLLSLLLSQPRIEIASPVTVSVELDPPVVRPGEESALRISFNALEDSIEMPAKWDASPGLEARPGARGQIFQMSGANMLPRTTFLYRLRSATPGEFTIPQRVVQVYDQPVTIPAAKLLVAANPPPNRYPMQELSLEFTSTNLYVGQAVRAAVVLPSASAGIVQGLGQVQFKGDGFLADQTAIQQRIEPRARGGTNITAFIYEGTLIPIASGRLKVAAQAFAIGNRFPFTPPPTNVAQAIMPQYTLVDSESRELVVRPLPREGQLPGFTGAVGTFTLEPPVLLTNVIRVGEPTRLRVNVRGSGNLARLVPPPPPRDPNWRVYPGSGNQGQPAHLQGFIALTFNLMPLSEEARTTPAIPFSFFDPARDQYVDLTIPPLSVTVLPGPNTVDLQALRAESPAPPEPELPVLSGLATAPGVAVGSLAPVQRQAWFPVVQIAPAVFFLGLWLWDKRRRYLEQHPEVVLRRRARRALRREYRVFRRAGEARNASAFATSAVRAMRVACAPDYPAEPRALVCGDILEVLSKTGVSSEARQAVRRFFAVTDAVEFGRAPADGAELLALRPQVEQVLAKLEERL
jgi:hypothetical protein